MEKYMFKGKRIDNGEWIYGDCLHFNNGCIIIVPHINILAINIEELEVTPETVCQYTGIKDKNDVKIYRGDIIQAYNGFNMIIGIVKFGEYEQDGSSGEYNSITCTGVYVERIKTIPTKEEIEYNLLDLLYEPSYEKTDSLQSYEYIEVIGNVYDNSELLENIE